MPAQRSRLPPFKVFSAGDQHDDNMQGGEAQREIGIASCTSSTMGDAQMCVATIRATATPAMAETSAGMVSATKAGELALRASCIAVEKVRREMLDPERCSRRGCTNSQYRLAMITAAIP